MAVTFETDVGACKHEGARPPERVDIGPHRSARCHPAVHPRLRSIILVPT